jgi:hypothetical protein
MSKKLAELNLEQKFLNKEIPFYEVWLAYQKYGDFDDKSKIFRETEGVFIDDEAKKVRIKFCKKVILRRKKYGEPSEKDKMISCINDAKRFFDYNPKF